MCGVAHDASYGAALDQIRCRIARVPDRYTRSGTRVSCAIRTDDHFVTEDSTQSMKFVAGSPLSTSACVCAMAHTVAKSTLRMP